MSRNIYCSKCGKIIYPNGDYLKVEEYFGGKLTRETYYHRTCMDKDKKKKEFLTAGLLGMMGRANKLLKQAENG